MNFVSNDFSHHLKTVVLRLRFYLNILFYRYEFRTFYTVMKVLVHLLFSGFQNRLVFSRMINVIRLIFMHYHVCTSVYDHRWASRAFHLSSISWGWGPTNAPTN